MNRTFSWTSSKTRNLKSSTIVLILVLLSFKNSVLRSNQSFFLVFHRNRESLISTCLIKGHVPSHKRNDNPPPPECLRAWLQQGGNPPAAAGPVTVTRWQMGRGRAKCTTSSLKCHAPSTLDPTGRPQPAWPWRGGGGGSVIKKKQRSDENLQHILSLTSSFHFNTISAIMFIP